MRPFMLVRKYALVLVRKCILLLVPNAHSAGA
jgi:hypothetical protein